MIDSEHFRKKMIGSRHGPVTAIAYQSPPAVSLRRVDRGGRTVYVVRWRESGRHRQASFDVLEDAEWALALAQREARLRRFRRDRFLDHLLSWWKASVRDWA